jgi:hypothetical protein
MELITPSFSVSPFSLSFPEAERSLPLQDDENAVRAFSSPAAVLTYRSARIPVRRQTDPSYLIRSVAAETFTIEARPSHEKTFSLRRDARTLNRATCDVPPERTA